MKELQLCDRQASLISSLKKLQFDKDDIQLFMSYSNFQKITLLKKQRKIMLQKAHEYYQLIDQIDYMIKEYQGGKISE